MPLSPHSLFSRHGHHPTMPAPPPEKWASCGRGETPPRHRATKENVDPCSYSSPAAHHDHASSSPFRSSSSAARPLYARNRLLPRPPPSYPLKLVDDGIRRSDLRIEPPNQSASSRSSSRSGIRMGEAMDDVYEDELLDYEEDDDASAAKPTGEVVQKGNVGIHNSGFRDFLLKLELLRVQDCGFEHPSKGARLHLRRCRRRVSTQEILGHILEAVWTALASGKSVMR